MSGQAQSPGESLCIDRRTDFGVVVEIDIDIAPGLAIKRLPVDPRSGSAMKPRLPIVAGAR